MAADVEGLVELFGGDVEQGAGYLLLGAKTDVVGDAVVAGLVVIQRASSVRVGGGFISMKKTPCVALGVNV